MVVVDTNIVFAVLVDTDWSADARKLYARDPDWRTELHALVELSNVLVRHVRATLLTRAKAIGVMSDAERRFGAGLARSTQTAAMEMALAYNVSAYDARFLVVAAALGAPLVTEDAKLRRAAPLLTRSLHDSLQP